MQHQRHPKGLFLKASAARATTATTTTTTTSPRQKAPESLDARQPARDNNIIIDDEDDDDDRHRPAKITNNYPQFRIVPWSFLPLQIYRNVYCSSPPTTTVTTSTTAAAADTAASSNDTIIVQPLMEERLLRPVYIDEHIIVIDKPSGILSVPGPARKHSLLDMVHALLHQPTTTSSTHSPNKNNDMDQMVVHRLDMDTSGLIIYARHERALKKLHADFRSPDDDDDDDRRKTTTHHRSNKTTTTRRNNKNIKKVYEALVCGTVIPDEGDIDLPLARDVRRVPFMRVSTTDYEREVTDILTTEGDDDDDDDDDANGNGKIRTDAAARRGWRKMVGAKAKPSRTLFRVIGREWFEGCPVTRLELRPLTGRTHQLRVHCAAMGHPILSDPIYGCDGDGSPNGGFDEVTMDEIFPHRAGLSLQRDIREATTTAGRRLCLHAKMLGLEHPVTGAPLWIEVDAPF